MNILFVGIGSIAKRHIKNLKLMLGESISISALRSGNGGELDLEVAHCVDEIFTDQTELKEKYDAVFITNPTGLHYNTLQECLNVSDCFFIEKPVFLTGNEDTDIFKKKNKKYYVACPLRYCNVIQYLKENIDFRRIYSIRCMSSSYLPSWRPETDYRKCYSAHKKMGGGVSIDLIHEWDYIQYLVGFPVKVNNIISKKSNLEIDSDDIAVYIAEYESKVVELHLDYFGRKTLRTVELYAEDDTIVGDLEAQTIKWLSSGRSIDLSQGRNDYQQKELRHFLDIVEGKAVSDNTLEEACRTLKIARGN